MYTKSLIKYIIIYSFILSFLTCSQKFIKNENKTSIFITSTDICKFNEHTRTRINLEKYELRIDAIYNYLTKIIFSINT